jgi:hypothetical protein
MNTVRRNPILIAIMNAVLTLAAGAGTIYILSLVQKIPFLTKVQQTPMLIILIAGPIIAGISAYFRAKSDRNA